MGAGTDTLSRAVSALWRERDRLAELDADPMNDAMGYHPSFAVAGRLEAIAHAHGFKSLAALEHALERRVDGKWLWSSGLYSLIGLARMEGGR